MTATTKSLGLCLTQASFRSEAGFQSASGKKERLFAHSAKAKGVRQ